MAVTPLRKRRAARRRRRRVSSADNDLTATQWGALRAAWGGCAYCAATDVPLQRDCVQPIAHGGRYTLTNVVPACASCNASKCEGEVTAWLRRKRLDERAFLVRQWEIATTLASEQSALSPSA
ncbi:MAG TPA: HNH endonuclease [Propionibacteriaceae bacterium]|nr:HNH endonuclease [Micropruina sp.]HBX82177.1 HNH endonuclease [Propionibacteriaceae bacterium]HBY21951.1 HNH endonuclease [Propionibacteriaceae bacterium]